MMGPQQEERAALFDQFSPKDHIPGNTCCGPLIVDLSGIRTHLCAAAAALEDEMTSIAKGHDLSRRLMTMHETAPAVALNYLALVENKERFCKN